MPKRPFNQIKFRGINNTDDPFLVGQTDPSLSAGGWNFRAEKGIRIGRGGYAFLAGQTDLKRSGVYFPYGAKAILPLTKEKANLADTFFLAGESNFTIEFWYRTDYYPGTRYVCRAMDLNIDGNTEHMNISFYQMATNHQTGIELKFITGSAGSYTQADYYYEGIETDGTWHHIALKRDYSSGVDIQLDGGASAAMTATTASSDALVDADSIFNVTSLIYNDNPLYGNHLEIGDHELHIAEFRIWRGYRDDTDVLADMNVQVEV